jgi:hypothetical protein
VCVCVTCFKFVCGVFVVWALLCVCVCELYVCVCVLYVAVCVLYVAVCVYVCVCAVCAVCVSVYVPLCVCGCVSACLSVDPYVLCASLAVCKPICVWLYIKAN